MLNIRHQASFTRIMINLLPPSYSFHLAVLFIFAALEIHLLQKQHDCTSKAGLGGETSQSDVDMHKGYSMRADAGFKDWYYSSGAF